MCVFCILLPMVSLRQDRAFFERVAAVALLLRRSEHDDAALAEAAEAWADVLASADLEALEKGGWKVLQKKNNP